MKNIPDDYVQLGKHICRVCGKEHDSGEVLLHKQLRSIPKDKTITGYGLCEEHQKQFDDGYVFLIEAIPHDPKVTNPKPSEVTRSGKIISIRGEAFEQMFNVDIPEHRTCFVEKEVVNMLENLNEKTVNN